MDIKDRAREIARNILVLGAPYKIEDIRRDFEDALLSFANEVSDKTRKEERKRAIRECAEIAEREGSTMHEYECTTPKAILNLLEEKETGK